MSVSDKVAFDEIDNCCHYISFIESKLICVCNNEIGILPLFNQSLVFSLNCRAEDIKPGKELVYAKGGLNNQIACHANKIRDKTNKECFNCIVMIAKTLEEWLVWGMT